MALGKRLRDTEDPVASPASKQSKIADFFAPNVNHRGHLAYAVETANGFSILESISDSEKEACTSSFSAAVHEPEDITQMEVGKPPHEINKELVNSVCEHSCFTLIARMVKCIFRSTKAIDDNLANLTLEIKKLSTLLGNSNQIRLPSNLRQRFKC